MTTTNGSQKSKSDTILQDQHHHRIQNGGDDATDNNINNSGSSTRPASWPRDPPNPDSTEMEMMIAQNATRDPVLLNVGGTRFEVSTVDVIYTPLSSFSKSVVNIAI